MDNAWTINDYACGARGMAGIWFLAEREHTREFGVYGTEGSICINTSDNETIHVTRNDGRREEYDYSMPGPDMARGGPRRGFIDCIRAGEEPSVNGEMGKSSLLVSMAAGILIIKKRVASLSELQWIRDERKRR